MLKAVIFDMDGVLTDTEHIQSQAFEAVLREYDIIPTPNEHGTIHIAGESTSATWTRLTRQYSLDVSIEILTEKKRRAAMKAMHQPLTVLPGVRNLLADIKKTGTPVAVGTSAQRERLDLILHKLGLAEVFTTTVSSSDIAKPKPAPDTYLEVARRLDVSPSKCIVIEDTLSGVRAATSAGMKVVAVPNQHTRSMDFGLAAKIVTSLEELTYNQLCKVFAAGPE